jgi:hypothetical protein
VNVPTLVVGPSRYAGASGAQVLLLAPDPSFDARPGARTSHPHVTNHTHQVNAAEQLNMLLEGARDGLLEGSLLDLAIAAGCDVETMRRAVASLDPIDHVLTADVQCVSAEEQFGIAWAPVTSAVNLLLDWDLLTLEIAIGELSQWLGVSPVVTSRAIAWLALTPGVAVRETDDESGTIHIAVALERCPLTAEVPSVAG